MSRIWTYIKGIKATHKVAIILLIVSFITTINNHVLTEFDGFNLPWNSPPDLEYIFIRLLLFTTLYVFIIPAYMIIYNILYFIKIGYSSKYDFKNLKLYQKFIHYLGLLYFLFLFFIAYVITNGIMVDRAVPVAHLTKSISQIGGDKIHIEGIWVKDRRAYEGFNTNNVGEKYGDTRRLTSVSINCDKINMICRHQNISVTISGSGTGFISISNDYSSTIKSWSKDYITSETEYTCYVDSFKFDLTSEKGSFRRTSTNVDTCRGLDKWGAGPGDYTLWDGVDLYSAMQGAENGRVMKMIGAVLGL